MNGRADLLPRRRELVALVCFSAVVLLFALGSGSLRDWDEAIYAQVAREMFEAGEWLTPRLDDRSWFHKPPLVLWTTIFGYHVFGVGELAPRLASALSGVFATALVLICGSRMFGRTAGVVAAAAFLGTPMALELAKSGMLDMVLTAALIAAFYAWWRSEESPGWLIAVGAALGIAALTKGAAAGLGILVLAAHLLCMRRFEVLARWQLWMGVIVALAIAGPWHLHQLWLHGSVFWDEYVGYHVLSRAGSGIEGNEAGAGFYFAVLADEGRPWSWIALMTLPYVAWEAFRSRSSALALVALWGVICIAVPSLMSTKLDWYVLPAIPALALSIGAVAEMTFDPRHHRRVRLLAILLLVVGLATTRPVWNLDHSGEVKALAQAYRNEVGPDDKLCIYRMNQPAARFYFERRVRRVRTPDDERLAQLAARQEQVLCLTKLRFTDELSGLGGSVVGRNDELALVAFPPGALR